MGGAGMGLTGYLDLRAEDVKGATPLDEPTIPEDVLARLRSTSAYETPSWDTTAVRPTTADERLRSLARFYGTAPREVQRSMRAAVGQIAGLDLLLFALRSTVFALREGSRDLLRDAILAIALENLANDDPRDDIVLLHKIYGVGRSSGNDPLELFKEALPHTGAPVARILNDYFLQQPLDEIGRGFSFEAIETQAGMAFLYP
jgi:hypothetical protein